jgi:hypothetical protein
VLKGLLNMVRLANKDSKASREVTGVLVSI